MTPYELKHEVIAHNPDTKFFDRKTMQFFGDTMANYGCRKATVLTHHGTHDVWELWRKRPVKNGLKRSAYFCRETFERVFIIANV